MTCIIQICGIKGGGIVQCRFSICRIAFHPYCGFNRNMLLIIRESKISNSQKGGHNSYPYRGTGTADTDGIVDTTVSNNNGSGVYETKYELYCPDHEEYCNLNGMISSTHDHDPADTDTGTAAADPTTTTSPTTSASITNSNIHHIHTSACHNNSNSNNTHNPSTLQRQGTLVTKKRAITLTQAITLHESPQQNDPPLYNSSGKPITNRLKRYAHLHTGVYIYTYIYCVYIYTYI